MTTLRALALMLLALPSIGTADIAHHLEVRLDPSAQRIDVRDTVTLPRGRQRTEFLLHAGLAPQIVGDDAELRLLTRDTGAGGVPLERYAITLSGETQQFTLRYGGRLHHRVAGAGEQYARGFRMTPGLVDARGVYLSGASAWYPIVDGELVTFRMSVVQPAAWRSMSQGQRMRAAEHDDRVTDVWHVDEPQQQVLLIAGPFIEYARAAGAVQALVLLREPAPSLAATYLEATGQYLETYRKLIGPYPYTKFALVENFWETGLGMPSFTLLGPRVIRLPFILHSSYPHEILHSWWGNGVYVDYATGNWAEGLTSYLADHLVKEQRGQAVDYRRRTLQKYADYVRAGRDFALREFRGRHGSVSEAVGYGKTLMLFHMLRRQLGDEHFTRGLQHLYRSQRFRVASFDEVRDSFAAVSGESLDAFFAQWTERVGAPALRVRDTTVTRIGERFRLSAIIEQTHDEAPYTLRVPIAVHLEGSEHAFQQDVAIEAREQRLELTFDRRPLRLDVDPEFDVFRRLDRAEIPPALSQALGAERALFVLPSQAPGALAEGYRALVESLRRGRGRNAEIVMDSDFERLPDDRSVWLLGWQNRFRATAAASLADYRFAADVDGVTFGDTRLTRARDTIVAVGRRERQPEHALVWIALDDIEAMLRLGRKLPHYGRYGYLGFRGVEVENVAKGQWPVRTSPMSVPLAEDADNRAQLAERRALIDPPG